MNYLNGILHIQKLLNKLMRLKMNIIRCLDMLKQPRMVSPKMLRD